MRIIISGKAEKIENKQIRIATKFFLHQLLKPNTIKKLNICIFLEQDLFKNTGHFAEMFPTEISIRPKDYEIVLDSKLSEKILITSLAHEIIHIKQYVTDEMRIYSKSNDVMWRGERYSENINYWKTPWEIEAYKGELELYSCYKQRG